MPGGFLRNFSQLRRLLPTSSRGQSRVTEVEDRLQLTAELLGANFNNGMRFFMKANGGLDVNADPAIVALHEELPVPEGFVLVPVHVSGSRSGAALGADISLHMTAIGTPDDWGLWRPTSGDQTIFRAAGAGAALQSVDFTSRAFPIPRGNVLSLAFHTGGIGALGGVVFAALVVPGELLNVSHFLE